MIMGGEEHEDTAFPADLTLIKPALSALGEGKRDIVHSVVHGMA
jgi:hypothetical protein